MARSSCLLICVSLLLGACAKSSVPPNDGGGSTGCFYGGNHYAAGHTFQSSDGCNECACDQSGNVACTARACVDAAPRCVGRNTMDLPASHCARPSASATLASARAACVTRAWAVR
jgi:hypothetical protein